ncbi:hypothetical protein EDB92DRAFT_1994323 [Lactarius akahatsu]|uniref:ABC transporter domain-containing protein n=1 Tax=Lactarius akahatsu TaxID=416441 RepID=A0AAD4L4Q2_9AGAM|nr:hypothetical protein EDB92DRAFT_1994323 [Lactarius akahatsu]
MSSYDIAEKIRESLPGTEEILVQYLSGYLVDDASDDEDISQVARYILESIAVDKPDVLEQLMASLTTLLQDQLVRRESSRSGPKLQRLDKVLDMSKTGAMSNTIAFSEGVDLESINKGNFSVTDTLCRKSVMDVKKLEKQEAKLKAKIEKRARRDLYEGSKLLEQTKKQQSYEEMFMKINPLQSAATSKNKSKDTHLPSIDVSFGSNRILSRASLTLAYGIIGRNGVGKSTLLRHIAMREVPIPPHITTLFVEQEARY